MHCQAYKLFGANAESKHFKPSSDDASKQYFRFSGSWSQIKAIPLIYKRFGYQGDPKLIRKISVKGYKHLSRVVASGEFTKNILNTIKQTSCLKSIRNIDFDPYFSETSELKPLSEVLKKLRRLLSNLTLIFRRVKTRQEVDQFCLFLARSHHTSRIKIEIPNHSGMDSQDFKYLSRGCKRFVCLKDVDVSLGGSKDVYRSVHKIRDIFANSKRLEKLRLYIYFSHTKPNSMEPSPVEMARRRRRTRFAKNLKSLSLSFAFKTGWASFFDGNEIGQGLQVYLQRMPNFANPVEFSLTFEKIHMPLNVLKEIGTLLGRFTNLRSACIELNSMKLAEFELLVLAKGFVDCKQIEHLTFKLLDNVTMPMADLMQFIVIMAKHATIPKFDLFFRKIFYAEWQTPEAKRTLEGLENINCVMTKRSIHIFKN